MYEIKVNLIMTLPGRIMMSEQECLRKVRKPLMGKGKKANKQVIDKNGNPVWHTVLEADPAKTDRFQIDFVDKNGKLVIPCKYENLYNDCGFSEGLVGVSIDGGEDGVVDDKWGYIDKTGKIVIPFQTGLSGSPFSSGLSMRYRGGLTFSHDKNGFPVMHKTAFEGAFIYKNGKQATDFFETQNIEGFRKGYCTIKDKNGWEGLVNTRGEFTIPCKYSFIANGFDDKYVLIQINNKMGFANKATGQIAIPPIYEIGYSGWSFKEGLIPVKKDGKYGYINEHNQIVIPFNYDDAFEFSEGFAVVQRYGKYGYVDRFGHDTFN